jgi:hypothetical protein
MQFDFFELGLKVPGIDPVGNRREPTGWHNQVESRI